MTGATLELLKNLASHPDPFPTYAAMADDGPLHRTDEGFWLSTTYDSAEAVLRSRDLGVRERPDHTHISDRDFYLSFLQRNPPAHTHLRSVLAPAFVSGALSRLEVEMANAARERVDELAAHGSVDLVDQYARWVPARTMDVLLGIPEDLQDRFHEATYVLADALDGRVSADRIALLYSAKEFVETMCLELMARRKGHGGTDAVSLVSNAPIDDGERLPMLMLLVTSGIETTANTISAACRHLLDERRLWAAVRREEGYADRIASETLRWDCPVQRTGRIALRDTTVFDQRIRESDEVIVLLAQANRDARVYDDPDVFDPDRPMRRPPLSFSSGAHFCLGHALARLEIAVSLRALVQRLDSGVVIGRPVTRDGPLVRGYQRIFAQLSHSG